MLTKMSSVRGLRPFLVCTCSYECFFIKGSNIFTAVDDAGSKNMAYIASDKCTWDHDNKTLTCD